VVYEGEPTDQDPGSVVSPANPYNWDAYHPGAPLLDRSSLDTIMSHLLAGMGCILLGGRGMGKSVLFTQVEKRITAEDPSAKIVRFDGPPIPETLEGALAALAAKLGLADASYHHATELFEQYFARHTDCSRCILLFDELDQYASLNDRASLGRKLFNHLEVTRKGMKKRLGILAAGGLGVYSLRDSLGSAFLARAKWVHPTSFTEPEIEELSRPFKAKNAPLPPGVLKAVHLASGGNPALAAYGLQHLWDITEPAEDDVGRIYASFQEDHKGFLQGLLDAIAQPEFSDAPLRVWHHIRGGGVRFSRAELLQSYAASSGSFRMDLDQILDLLISAGFIVASGSLRADPLEVRAIASIVNLPESTTSGGSTAERLVTDLMAILARVHSWAPDFFQQGESKGNKVLVPEANFSAFLGMALVYMGWTVEREAVQGKGRNDLKLTRSGQGAIVEVKIWGRNDYDQIHEQVEEYWTSGVVAGAAVMITDKDLRSFANKYRSKCLSRPDLTVTEQTCGPPLAGRFTVESVNKNGFPARVDHLLLRLPR
jgi:hypothetical protein